ncbi:hypothetical protein BZB76_1682 [Actinomadura pelletieri DSM 43383]|uniref:Uncharacterized protein n=1 Tax=Actinomadura pelletieri DSM 43383 TaxID=1120940 RepID=A0A495QSA0_9ACTN|nr:hypothetical protein [Actinomadura pelletieri]RKS76328.1 hypothetical protein BZB76_1682 [Actinomadura pelletieri DSM 43383]
MSARRLSLLTMTAALALTASLGTANAALAVPPPSPADTKSTADGNPKPDPQHADLVGSPKTNAMPAGPSSNPSPAEAGKPPAKPKSKPKSPPKGESKPVAKDGTDLHACLDARCEVEVRSGQEIQLDGRYGVEEIEVELHGGQATLFVRGNGSTAIASMTTTRPGPATAINGVRISAYQVAHDTVILNISHA